MSETGPGIAAGSGGCPVFSGYDPLDSADLRDPKLRRRGRDATED
jgi:hypothetical protein